MVLGSIVPFKYVSDSSTDTKLVFTHTVESGDTTSGLAYENTGALVKASGATIVYRRISTGPAFGANTALVVLAAPGGANSLSNGRTIVVDSTKPTVLSVASALVDGTYGIGAVLTVDITYDQQVKVLSGPKP
jgi:hypothetical protein